MRNSFAILLASLLTLFFAVPAAAAFNVLTFEGALLPKIDEDGVFGTPGANLDGLPFSYSLYYKDSSFVRYGPLDFSYSIIRVSGQIGAFRIPYQTASGSINQFDFGPIYTGNPTGNFPSFFFKDDFNPEFAGAHLFLENFSAPIEIRSGSGGVISGSIPEPSTWFMLLFGFALVGVSLRATRSKSRALISGHVPADQPAAKG